MKTFAGLKLLGLAVMAGALSTPAWATLTLNVGGTSNGSGGTTGGTPCTDGAACDTDGAMNGSITYGLAVGSITVTALNATSTSPMGTLSFAINGTPTATGTGLLHFTIEDSGFTTPHPPGMTIGETVTWNSNAIGGTVGSATSVGTYVLGGTPMTAGGAGTTSTAIATASGDGAGTNLNGSSFSPSIGGSSGAYSLTEYITINVSALGTNPHLQVTADLSAVATPSVPEPASVSLLGGALLLAAAGLKKKLLS